MSGVDRTEKLSVVILVRNETNAPHESQKTVVDAGACA
jgi:hypothetical protein